MKAGGKELHPISLMYKSNAYRWFVLALVFTLGCSGYWILGMGWRTSALFTLLGTAGVLYPHYKYMLLRDCRDRVHLLLNFDPPLELDHVQSVIEETFGSAPDLSKAGRNWGWITGAILHVPISLLLQHLYGVNKDGMDGLGVWLWFALPFSSAAVLVSGTYIGAERITKALAYELKTREPEWWSTVTAIWAERQAQAAIRKAEEKRAFEERRLAGLRTNTNCGKCGKVVAEGWECTKCRQAYCASCGGDSESRTTYARGDMFAAGDAVVLDLTQPDQGPACPKCRREMYKWRNVPRASGARGAGVQPSDAAFGMESLLFGTPFKQRSLLKNLYKHITRMQQVNINNWYYSKGNQYGPREPFDVMDAYFESADAVIVELAGRNDLVNITLNYDSCIIEFDSMAKLYALLRDYENRFYWWNIWQK